MEKAANGVGEGVGEGAGDGAAQRWVLDVVRPAAIDGSTRGCTKSGWFEMSELEEKAETAKKTGGSGGWVSGKRRADVSGGSRCAHCAVCAERDGLGTDSRVMGRLMAWAGGRSRTHVRIDRQRPRQM